MTNIKFEDWEAELLQDEEIQKIAEEMEPGYQVARLRMRLGITQAELAKRIGSHQSSIARLESGRVIPRLSFLRDVVAALGGTVEVNIKGPEPVAVSTARGHYNDLFVRSYVNGNGNTYANVDDWTQASIQEVEIGV